MLLGKHLTFQNNVNIKRLSKKIAPQNHFTKDNLMFVIFVGEV
jgi:hypothetical protein